MEHTLPATDSRLRADLRCLTQGNVKQAGKEKVAIEERERRKRRERDAQGKKWAPVYFKVSKSKKSGELIGSCELIYYPIIESSR
jgi:Oxysterol-binding protein